jgi:hypothetical protein
MKAFWDQTLPEALDKRFQDVQAPVATTLRRLEAEVELVGHGPADDTPSLQGSTGAAVDEPAGSGT